jgi:sn1-specific diacylglycerol lipase
MKTTGIKQEDIIYASFFNRVCSFCANSTLTNNYIPQVYEIPFFVALDHQHQAVVIAIRGTLSLKDTLTDMTADSDHMDVEGVEDAHAHKGILQAARFIMNTLNNLQLLHSAFRNATVRLSQSSCM